MFISDAFRGEHPFLCGRRNKVHNCYEKDSRHFKGKFFEELKSSENFSKPSCLPSIALSCFSSQCCDNNYGYYAERD